jgi:C1A family cysteine protease
MKDYQVAYSKYPYVSGDGTAPSCNNTADKGGQVKVTSHAQVKEGSQEALKDAIKKGVVTVSVDASSHEFNFYSSGIFDNATACGTNLDHAIAAVGYGKNGDDEYYIVRNSWSAMWGEKGYIKMKMTGNGAGMCGI